MKYPHTHEKLLFGPLDIFIVSIMTEPKNISRRSIGDRGEEIALRYLEEKGYSIIQSNYQIKGGEIDIIAREDGMIIFIEVRYRRDESHGHPLDTFGVTKRRTLKRAIMYYLMKHSISPEMIRVDFIGIMPKSDGSIGHRVWHIKGVEI